jgi:nicotinamide phosphoribosyltransferase
MYINPLTAIDFYKADHRNQYPAGTTEVYSNLSARSDKLANVLGDFDHKVVFFGLQYFLKSFLIDEWNNNFFSLDVEHVIEKYKRRMFSSLHENCFDFKHIRKLHELGYLPIKIKALPEGSRVPIGVPLLTIVNTHPEFFWLTNYIETVLSCYMWKPITSATTAYEYKRLLTKYAEETGANLEFINFQAHDFSFRGMSSIYDAALSGAAHLTSFLGTDTVPAIDLIEDYYFGSEPIGFSVPATEHSVMCMGSKQGEFDTFKRLITETYPEGIVSIVSDTWDFWKVITDYLPKLKKTINERNGKVVIRPDSGDPVKIICGDESAKAGSPEYMGAVGCLWDTFGGTETEKGFKRLDQKIGLIYGDSITLDRAKRILELLKLKGFSSDNVVFGVGSYTYQYVTRDSFGFAVKATSGVVNGERKSIFKDPATDNGSKKSAKGLLKVNFEDGEYKLYDNVSESEEMEGSLKVVFENGIIKNEEEFCNIRDRLYKYL